MNKFENVPLCYECKSPVDQGFPVWNIALYTEFCFCFVCFFILEVKKSQTNKVKKQANKHANKQKKPQLFFFGRMNYKFDFFQTRMRFSKTEQQ